MNKKQRSYDGRGGGAQRPILFGNELKKMGARSARARTRGQNPLVLYNGYMHPKSIFLLTDVVSTSVYGC
jgi:hypothetical protein